MRYFEDFHVGETMEFGSHTVTREEIAACATQFDPQRFHLDDVIAARSIFGGLTASGWHTASLSLRLFVDAVLLDSSSLAGAGIDALRWLKPVRPGDSLRVRWTVLSATRSKSRPDRGLVHNQIEVFNQNAEKVLIYDLSAFFGARNAAPQPADA